MLKNLYKQLQKPYPSFFLFWVFVYLFSAGTSNWFFSSTEEIMVTYAFIVTVQFIVAYVTLFYLIPNFLNKDHKITFSLLTIILLVFAFLSCSLIRIYILEPNYPLTYASYLKRLPDNSIYSRLTNIKDFISKVTLLTYPTVFLLAFKFHKTQKHLLKLNEQKKTAELSALKNQLNPHFLFNTLNNLHALVLNKSDQSSNVIQKLSNILDYILYRCNDNYVPLEKEIELLEDYIVLEKIRYGNRMAITFDKKNITDAKIAPLLLLTFIENAFKHGVSQELNLATIKIKIEQLENQIVFNIENSKPSTIGNNTKKNNAIGLQNIKKQLKLLYPDAFDLNITTNNSSFNVNLKLRTI
ncbi:MAG: histidine kinase [Cellulophaga sp.]